ncbi:MAG: DUF723 domain-containing protein [Thiohalomonadaceae bacterium]
MLYYIMAKKSNKEEFVRKARKIHGDRYVYDKVDYRGSKVPVTIICPEHGNFDMTPGNHLNRGQGCRDCYIASISMTPEDFEKRAREVHGDKFDYSKANFTETRNPVTIICPVHGKFKQRASSHLDGYGCRECASEALVVEMSREEFVEKAREVHGEKYLYHLIPETISRLAYTRGKFVCPIHGVFTQTYDKHLNGQGCRTCSYQVNSRRPRTTLEEAEKRAREVHGDLYEYISLESGTLTYRCKEHGEVSQNLYSHLAGIRCPRCSSNISTQHNRIIGWLDDIGESYEVNKRGIIGRKELDLYFPEKKLAIEINGEYFHTHRMLQDRQYHYKKFIECEEQGIRLLQFWGNEIDEKPELVRSMIYNALGLVQNKLYARECKVVDVSPSAYREFLDINHLEGAKNSKVKLGLEHDGMLVSVMGFSTRNDGYELDRFCSLMSTVVVGGFSKLFKHRPPGKITSYSYNRYSNGALYGNLGFDMTRENKVSLFYFMDGRLYNRANFMKHKSREALGLPDNDARSEIELAAMRGAEQLFDAGTRTWVFSN